MQEITPRDYYARAAMIEFIRAQSTPRMTTLNRIKRWLGYSYACNFDYNFQNIAFRAFEFADIAMQERGKGITNGNYPPNTTTSVTISNPYRTVTVKGESSGSDDILDLFVDAMVGLTFEQTTVREAIMELADSYNLNAPNEGDQEDE